MSKKHKKICNYIIWALNYIEHLLIAISTITGCVSIFAFASLIGVPIGITSSAIRLQICVITGGTKKYKSKIKKKNKMHDKIVFLAKSKLNTIEVLISNAWIDSNISHDNFFVINKVPKEFYGKIKNSNDK